MTATWWQPAARQQQCAGASQASRWLVGLHTNHRAHLRLFCFPFAGGGPSAYCHWPQLLPPSIELVRVQLPSSTGNTIESMAQALMPHMRTALDLPYVLFGYSMGALVAYEIASMLQDQHLRYPHQCQHSNPTKLPERLAVAAAAAPNTACPIPWSSMSDRQLMRQLQITTPPSPTLRQHLQACESFNPAHRAPLRCPITAYGASHDTLVPSSAIQPWQHITNASFHQHTLTGGHFLLLHEQRTRLPQLVSQAALRPLNLASQSSLQPQHRHPHQHQAKTLGSTRKTPNHAYTW